MSKFFIINADGSGVVGKKCWDHQHEAEKHAESVLKQSSAQSGFFVCETVSEVRRRSPPIETVDLKSTSEEQPNPAYKQAAE